MKRHTFKNAPYDCIDVPSSCPNLNQPEHEPERRRPYCGGSHGRHGEEWGYVSTSNDSKTAFTLLVYTDVFVAGSSIAGCDDDKPLARRRYGADLSLHVAFPVDDEQVRGVEKLRPCDFVEGGGCFTAWTRTGHDFFEAHGDPAQHEQPESFWLALEAKHEALGQVARKSLDKKKCDKCNGRGVVGGCA